MSIEIDVEIESEFDTDLIRKYPKANKKLSINVHSYGILQSDIELPETKNNGQSQFLSPHGIEFRTAEEYEAGALLKIHISLPDYWGRKRKFVDYARIDTPGDFRILARVIKTEEVGKRGRKRLVTCKTLVIDEVDEQVLKTFLQEG